MEKVWSAPEAFQLLSKPYMFDPSYKYVEDIMLRYKELDTPDDFGFKQFSRAMEPMDFKAYLFALVLFLLIRMGTLLYESESYYNRNYIFFNTSKKLTWLKRALTLLWLYQLNLILTQKFEHLPIKVILIAFCAYQFVVFLDLIPSWSKSDNKNIQSEDGSLIMHENRVENYFPEDEFIDSYNGWDTIILLITFSFIGINFYAYLYSDPIDLVLEEFSIRFSMEICLLTGLFLLKPYPAMSKHKLSSFVIPSLFIMYNLYWLLSIFEFSPTDILLLWPINMYFLTAIFGFYFFINVYLWWNKVEDEEIDDQQRILEEKIKAIQEQVKKEEHRQAIMITERQDNSGGLSGFHSIHLFEDISAVYWKIAEEFYRIKENGDVIKEDLIKFVKLTTKQSVNFIRKQFFSI